MLHVAARDYLMTDTPIPRHVHYHRDQRCLELIYEASDSHGRPPAQQDEQGQDHYLLSAELLRVYSPSAEVQGHSPEQAILQTGKRTVGLSNITPVGRYSLKLHFDDGHDSGLFTWEYLYRMAQEQNEWWARYLAELEAAGASRDAASIPFRAL